MRRPPYGRRVMSGILLIYRKMQANIENGYIPYWWTRQDINDAKRTLKWMGDFLDWAEWLREEKVAAEKARNELFPDGAGEVDIVEEEGEDV